AAPLVHVCHVRVLRHDVGDHALVAVAVPVAGDRGGDQLHADARRVGVVEVGPQVGGVVDVRVPGEHDRIGRARVAYAGQQTGPFARVTVPGVEVDRAPRADRHVALGHDDLLADEVPPGRRAAQPVQQPVPLVGAEEGAPGRVPGVAAVP